MAYIKLINSKDNTVKEIDDVSKVIVRTDKGSFELSNVLDLFGYATDSKTKSMAIHLSNGTVQKYPVSLWQISTIKV